MRLRAYTARVLAVSSTGTHYGASRRSDSSPLVFTPQTPRFMGTPDHWLWKVPHGFLMDQRRHEGALPLWNPLIFCGMPGAAHPTWHPFYPLNLLRSLAAPNPTPMKTHHLAGVGMAVLARDHDLSWCAALVAVLGEGKQDVARGVIPCPNLAGNQLCTLCAVMAHNLARELQVLAAPRRKRAMVKHPPVWTFGTPRYAPPSTHPTRGRLSASAAHAGTGALARPAHRPVVFVVSCKPVGTSLNVGVHSPGCSRVS